MLGSEALLPTFLTNKPKTSLGHKLGHLASRQEHNDQWVAAGKFIFLDSMFHHPLERGSDSLSLKTPEWVVARLQRSMFFAHVLERLLEGSPKGTSCLSVTNPSIALLRVTAVFGCRC